MPLEAEPSPPAWVRVIYRRRTREDPVDNSVGRTEGGALGHFASFYHEKMRLGVSQRKLLISIRL
jgi:hypothetical protein